MNITSSAGASITSASFTVSPVTTSGSAKSGASVPSGSICDSTLIPPSLNGAPRYAALVRGRRHSEDAIIAVYARWNHGLGGASAGGPDPGGPGGAPPHDPV